MSSRDYVSRSREIGRKRPNPDEQAAFEHFGSPDRFARVHSSSDAEQQWVAQQAKKNIVHVKAGYSNWLENPGYSRAPAGHILCQVSGTTRG